jgi:hypothetical protein
MNPLTEDQLSTLGFTIRHKKKANQRVFDYCEYVNYCFYRLPTFLEIVCAIEKHTRAETMAEIKDKIVHRLID